MANRGLGVCDAGYAHSSLIIPIWLLALWFCFGIWFLKADWINRNYLLMLFLGAIGGPLSYFTGFKLGAILFPLPLLPTMIFIAIDWSLLALILTQLNRTLGGDKKSDFNK